MRFHNGSLVEYEDCPRCGGEGRVEQPGRLKHEDIEWQTCPRCGGEKVRLRVERPAGGVARYRLDQPGEVERAYRMALDGPTPRPSAVTGKWYRPDDPALDRFGECPF